MLITISSYYAFKFQKIAIKNHDWNENESKDVTSSHKFTIWKLVIIKFFHRMKICKEKKTVIQMFYIHSTIHIKKKH